MQYEHHINKADYVNAIAKHMSGEVDDVLPLNYTDDYGLTYRPNVVIFFKDGSSVSLRWYAMECDETNSFMGRRAKSEAASAAAAMVKEAQNSLKPKDAEMLRSPAEAAEVIVKNDEFATNVQALNALYGVVRTHAQWTAKFGFSVTTHEDKLPGEVRLKMWAVQRLVAQVRNGLAAYAAWQAEHA